MSAPRQAPEGLRVRTIVGVGVACLLVGAAAVAVGAWRTPDALLHASPPRDARTPIAGIERAPLTEAPGLGLARQRAARRALDRYGFYDRERGLAEIPIERAMDLVARGVRLPGAPPRDAEHAP